MNRYFLHSSYRRHIPTKLTFCSTHALPGNSVALLSHVVFHSNYPGMCGITNQNWVMFF